MKGGNMVRPLKVTDLPPAKRRSFLSSRDGMKATRMHDRANWLLELKRTERRLIRDCPSSTWMEAAWERGEELPTGWTRCNVCGHLYPPQYVGSSGACYDCGLNAMKPAEWSQLPSSPSGLAILAAGAMGVKLRF